eukprot:CAMPEP_0197524854 /NCGR_PEP_ID=MMETSP1318-20131121/10134_1 /TAXON_ID=552666 /ORGANISM="Partenskyella glossopodia, Strain RCC365" /LENGTH=479 /DNA_ID=CAMNT_0043077925 /DNA_START=53 /DNA_END=1492 /DNA_ORIENTATION=+
MTDEYLAPMVAGALGYVSGHVAKLDTTISLGIGAATAVAGYIASKQSCSSKRRGKIAEDDSYEDEEEVDLSDDAVLPMTTKKKKKKKKGPTAKVPKYLKKSSYDEEVPLPAPKKVETPVEKEYEGLSKSQIKKLKKKKREEAKKAEEARKIAEAKKLAKKNKRRRKKNKKQTDGEEGEDEATRLARMEAERKKKEDEEGWMQPKEHIKKEKQKQEFEKFKALHGSKKNEGPKSMQYVKVPSSMRGKVFGKKAANIRLLEDRLKVKMTLPKQGGLHDVVTIEGAESQCDAAATALSELMEKGFSEYTNPGYARTVIPVPNGRIGAMMGSSGKNFREIVKVTKITTLEKDDDAKTITIIGPTASVEMAKEALEELADKGYSKLTHPTWVKFELPVSADKVPGIIGKKGANIQKITKATKTRITTKRNGDPMCVVVGDEKNVKSAIEMLQKSIAEQEIEAEPEPTPPEWQGVQNHKEEDLWN